MNKLYIGLLIGSILTAIILLTGQYIYKKGQENVTITIRNTTNLDFTCDYKVKAVRWTLITKKPFGGELYKDCIK